MKTIKYLYAYDVGTSSVKATVVDSSGIIHGQKIEHYPMFTPHPSWVEQDPNDYWKAVVKATNCLNSKISIPKEDIIGIVFTTQAMGIIPINSKGENLYKNISWVDGRAEIQAQKFMKKVGGSKLFKALIGIKLTGKDVIPKLMWIKEKHPEIYSQTEFFLDVNGYLKFKATGKKVAEWSGACSYAFDLKKKDWQKLIFKIGGIDTNKLPPLVRSTDKVGDLTEQAAKELNLPIGVDVFGGCDDTQSAAVGSSSIEEGAAHIYLGTSAWVGVSTSSAPKFKHGAVTLQSADPSKNLVVGITESAGIFLEWAAHELYKGKNLETDKDTIFPLMDKEIAEIPAGSDHLIATPWVLGERCPVSTTTTRATIFNLGLDHTRAHIVKAINEGIAYNLRWIIENYRNDFGFDMKSIKILGGASKSNCLMQIIADVTHSKIETLNFPRMGGTLGAAMCGFVGAGIYDNFEYIHNIVKVSKTFHPNPNNYDIYDKLFNDYKNLYFNLKDTYLQANDSRFN